VREAVELARHCSLLAESARVALKTAGGLRVAESKWMASKVPLRFGGMKRELAR